MQIVNGAPCDLDQQDPVDQEYFVIKLNVVGPHQNGYVPREVYTQLLSGVVSYGVLHTGEAR